MADEPAFLTLLNAYRRSIGAPSVQRLPILDSISAWMAADSVMRWLAGQGISHTDSLGRDPFQRMTALGYVQNAYEGEIICAGFATTQAAFDGFRASPEHDAIMRDPHYLFVGIAELTTSTGIRIWIADFASVDQPSAPVHDPQPLPVPATLNTVPRLIFPCPPFNSISNPFYGPPSVSGDLYHDAVDFPAPNGTPLLAPMSGIVTFTGVASSATGNMIEVSAGGFSARMLHLQSVQVSVGQQVRQGDVIGYTNNTGLTTGPHLHLAIWCDTQALALTLQSDPQPVYGRWAINPEVIGFDTLQEDDMTDEQARQLDTIFHWLTDQVPFPYSTSATTAPRIAVIETIYRIFTDDADPNAPGVQPRFGMLQDIELIKQAVVKP